MADGGWSDVQELAILEYYFNGGAVVNQTSTYCALCLSQPSDASNVISEPTYGGATPYARVQITQGQWIATGTLDPVALSNNVLVQFPECQVASTETVGYWALMSASSGGALLFSGAIIVPGPPGLDLGNGIQPQFDVGALQVRLGS